MAAGKIISVSELNIEVLLNGISVKKRDILYTIDEKGRKRRFEVAETSGKTARAIPFDSVYGLRRGMDMELEEEGLSAEYSENALGHVFDSYGNLIDGGQLENLSLIHISEPTRH